MLGRLTFNKLTCSASFAFNSCNKIKCTLPPLFFRYDQHQGFSIGEVCLLGNNHPWLLLENQFLENKDLSKIKTTERYEVIGWCQYIFTTENQTLILSTLFIFKYSSSKKPLTTIQKRKQLECKLLHSNDNTKYFALKKNNNNNYIKRHANL